MLSNHFKVNVYKVTERITELDNTKHFYIYYVNENITKCRKSCCDKQAY